MESGASGCQGGVPRLYPLASMYEVARNAACRLADWKKTLGPKQPGGSARSPRLTNRSMWPAARAACGVGWGEPARGKPASPEGSPPRGAPKGPPGGRGPPPRGAGAGSSPSAMESTLVAKSASVLCIERETIADARAASFGEKDGGGGCINIEGNYASCSPIIPERVARPRNSYVRQRRASVAARDARRRRRAAERSVSGEAAGRGRGG